VAREPRDLPEHAPQWPPRVGLRPKGKHPAELCGMVDVKIVQQSGEVAWPPVQCSVPVCSVQPAAASRLQGWHQTWDEWTTSRAASCLSLADKLEAMLEEAKTGGGPAKEKVSELTECYGELEEAQRELDELEVDGLEGVGEERMQTMQRGIQRFAALARFG